MRQTAGNLPVVVGHRGDDIVVVLTATDLAALGGDVEAFETALSARLHEISG